MQDLHEYFVKDEQFIDVKLRVEKEHQEATASRLMEMMHHKEDFLEGVTIESIYFHKVKLDEQQEALQEAIKEFLDKIQKIKEL